MNISKAAPSMMAMASRKLGRDFDIQWQYLRGIHCRGVDNSWMPNDHMLR